MENSWLREKPEAVYEKQRDGKNYKEETTEEQ
jgi:hypothetical protein